MEFVVYFVTINCLPLEKFEVTIINSGKINYLYLKEFEVVIINFGRINYSCLKRFEVVVIYFEMINCLHLKILGDITMDDSFIPIFVNY